jgi:hypothetical protein
MPLAVTITILLAPPTAGLHLSSIKAEGAVGMGLRIADECVDLQGFAHVFLDMPLAAIRALIHTFGSADSILCATLAHVSNLKGLIAGPSSVKGDCVNHRQYQACAQAGIIHAGLVFCGRVGLAGDMVVHVALHLEQLWRAQLVIWRSTLFCTCMVVYSASHLQEARYIVLASFIATAAMCCRNQCSQCGQCFRTGYHHA